MTTNPLHETAEGVSWTHMEVEVGGAGAGGVEEVAADDAAEFVDVADRAAQRGAAAVAVAVQLVDGAHRFTPPRRHHAGAGRCHTIGDVSRTAAQAGGWSPG